MTGLDRDLDWVHPVVVGEGYYRGYHREYHPGYRQAVEWESLESRLVEGEACHSEDSGAGHR